MPPLKPRRKSLGGFHRGFASSTAQLKRQPSPVANCRAGAAGIDFRHSRGLSAYTIGAEIGDFDEATPAITAGFGITGRIVSILSYHVAAQLVIPLIEFNAGAQLELPDYGSALVSGSRRDFVATGLAGLRVHFGPSGIFMGAGARIGIRSAFYAPRDSVRALSLRANGYSRGLYDEDTTSITETRLSVAPNLELGFLMGRNRDFELRANVTFEVDGDDPFMVIGAEFAVPLVTLGAS